MTIETATKRMLEEHIRDLAPRTQKDYEYLLTRHIIPKLGKLRVRDLDKPSVVRWHRGLVTKGRGHRQANFSLAVLSKLFSLAELWGERDEGTNPCYGVPRFREEKRQRYLNPEELRRLTKFLDGTITADCIRLLILTGIRIGELLALTWKQVDFDTRTITFKEHKTGRKVGVKTLPLSAGAVALLKAMPRLLGSPPKVCPETESSLERYWRDVRTRARLENVRLHDLRHTFASYGAARGLSMRALGGLLGQGHQATTERYAHLDVDPLREATEKISEALEAVMRKQG
jgi:integrase